MRDIWRRAATPPHGDLEPDPGAATAGALISVSGFGYALRPEGSDVE